MTRSLMCKFISLCCCCLATYSYAQPVLVFYPNWIRILAPSFVSGYIIIDLSEIIAIAMGYPHVFIVRYEPVTTARQEMVFTGIGCLMSFIIGVFELYQWTSWFSSVIEDTKVMGWQEFLLAISCLLNAAMLLLDLLHYVYQRPAAENAIENSAD